ncbi:beta family protein [Sphingobacterium bambusae]|uniref:Beta protein n=1 Tax=Sphingobacterium bambusae TaxID=662858 RepID=A0ABW6BLG9_9SPHI|nr:hypothetical protein [Sphingobacterium bambusae]WPL49686.1 hypothetical protein SCB77_04375 [Sphingobacterium bambusae]
MKKYYPILLSKSGELVALKNIFDEVKGGVSPIIQVLPGTDSKVLDFARDHWSEKNYELLIDFSLFKPFDEEKIANLIDGLLLIGVNAIPVISIDSDPRYLTMINKLKSTFMIDRVAIRLISNNGDFLKINENIESLLTDVWLERPEVLLILDFGLINKGNTDYFTTIATKIIPSLHAVEDFSSIIISSGSFPENLTNFLPSPNFYLIERYEWTFWKNLKSTSEYSHLISYSDYGTKNPVYVDANFAGTCSVKYTLEESYLIYRGEKSNNHPNGHGQFIDFANSLILSPEYSGETFSWGDGRVMEIAREKGKKDPKPGSLESWVQISQNHHISLIHHLL